ncbi:MAG: hypothetical protein ABI972_13445 [Acidobacteriota bacterium]
MQFTTTSSDRRVSSRFPIEREVKYRVLNKKGSQEQGGGRTLNISSSGILFTTEHVLLPEINHYEFRTQGQKAALAQNPN